jgi:hypothetical protein
MQFRQWYHESESVVHQGGRDGPSSRLVERRGAEVHKEENVHQPASRSPGFCTDLIHESLNCILEGILLNPERRYGCSVA